MRIEIPSLIEVDFDYLRSCVTPYFEERRAARQIPFHYVDEHLGPIIGNIFNVRVFPDRESGAFIFNVLPSLYDNQKDFEVALLYGGSTWATHPRWKTSAFERPDLFAEFYRLGIKCVPPKAITYATQREKIHLGPFELYDFQTTLRNASATSNYDNYANAMHGIDSRYTLNVDFKFRPVEAILYDSIVVDELPI